MKKALLAIVLLTIILLPVQSDTRTNGFPDQNKHHAIIRLEDVGPGGDYQTPDELGKLRAVLNYLEDNHVPFSVAVIPRSMHLQANGTWYNEGIDDSNPPANVKAFIALLQDAQKHGAVLGMHGYTHQYGTTKQPGNTQNSGTGYEFNVKGAPQTATTDFAADRITKSLTAFQKAGFTPGFWESPHYGDNRTQEEVFRSYMGILYQPDFYSLRSLKDLNTYETDNTYGTTTNGSVYVPAPFSYVTGQSTVTSDLTRLNNYRGLASLFFHPFLEFPYLEPVKDATGKTVIQNGLPLYQYTPGKTSYLHQLIPGFEQHHFKWVSLYDVVPFSPAHRITLPLGTKASDIMLGDMTGVGHADVAVRENDRVEVFADNYRWPRNRSPRPSTDWVQDHFTADDLLTLADVNGDRMDDLVSYNKKTGVVQAYVSDGVQFHSSANVGQLPAGFDSIKPFHAKGDHYIDLLLQKQNQVWVSLNDHGHYLPPQKMLEVPSNATLLTGDINGDKLDDVFYYSPNDKSVYMYRNTGNGFLARVNRTLEIPMPQTNAQVMAGDTNGDGYTDLIVYDAANGIWQVFQGGADYNFTPIDNLFGPWARGNRTGFSADFYGNGKADIASYDATQHVLDLALSFRGPYK